ncbi:hypothetical protein GCM10011318_23990 [Phaeocystidibacter marisrubri]|nr:hypothetical protein GCM10011318_23990 [Phaeocystidibacter marisrubri]
MNTGIRTNSTQMSLEQAYENAQLIEKEEVVGLVFPKDEVLRDGQSIKERAQRIHRATSLGNLEKYKVTIVFEDSVGLKKITTTIWAQTEKKIVLKGGNSVPVHRIWDVVI